MQRWWLGGRGKPVRVQHARRVFERRFKSSPPGVKCAAENFLQAEVKHAAKNGSNEARKQRKVPARPHHLPPRRKCAVRPLRARSHSLSLPPFFLSLHLSLLSLSLPPSPALEIASKAILYVIQYHLNMEGSDNCFSPECCTNKLRYLCSIVRSHLHYFSYSAAFNQTRCSNVKFCHNYIKLSPC